MEGPTPSSAVFYGALSVHLGAYLLLRVSPLLEASPVAGGGGGRARPGHGRVRLPGRERADGHQVGAVVRVAVAGRDHRRRDRASGCCGTSPWSTCSATPACGRCSSSGRRRSCRTTTRWRTPSASGSRRPAAPWAPASARRAGAGCTGWPWSAGYLDALLTDYVVGPFVRLFRWCDRLERRWTDFLVRRGASREADRCKPPLRTDRRVFMNLLATVPLARDSADPSLPWLSRLAVVVEPWCRDPRAGASRWGLAFTGAGVRLRLLAWLGFYLDAARGWPRAGASPPAVRPAAVPARRAQRPARADGRPAPLPDRAGHGPDEDAAVLVRRGRWRPRRSGWRRSVAPTRGRSSSCSSPGDVPPYFELRNRGRPTRRVRRCTWPCSSACWSSAGRRGARTGGAPAAPWATVCRCWSRS